MAKLIDLSYLEKVCEGDSEFMQEMISAFIETIPETLVEMKNANAAADWPGLARIAHKMKPSVAFMGIEELKSNILTLEALAKEGTNTKEIIHLVDQVNVTANQAIAELKEAQKSL